MADAMAGAAQGAAAGAAFGPWGAAIGAVAGALLAEDSKAQPTNGATGAGPGGASASAAQKATYGSSNLNADNWSVNFSGTQTNSPRVDKAVTASQDARPSATAATAGQGGYLGALPGLSYGNAGGLDPMWLAAGVVGVALLWKLASKK